MSSSVEDRNSKPGGCNLNTPTPDKSNQPEPPSQAFTEEWYDYFLLSEAPKPWEIEGISYHAWRNKFLEAKAAENRARVADNSSYGSGYGSVHAVRGGLPGLGKRR